MAAKSKLARYIVRKRVDGTYTICRRNVYTFPTPPPQLNRPNNRANCSDVNVVQARNHGKRLNIIIVSEGAVDENGNAITSEMVRNVLVNRLKQDARITVLGHVQRGGNPSAFDRILVRMRLVCRRSRMICNIIRFAICQATRMGAHAVLSLLKAKPDSETNVVCLRGNVIVEVSLMECVVATQEIAKAIEDKNFKKALELRGQCVHIYLRVL